MRALVGGDGMNTLVAGGAGFIGSHLCERLLRDGARVVCVDNLITGRVENIMPFLDHPAFLFVHADIVDMPALSVPVDRIYHLASPASPPVYQRYPVETLRANSEGTRCLLEMAVRHGARFLFASTSEIYGDPLVHPQPEEYRGNVSTTGPRSMYDEAKRYGEAVTQAYAETHGVETRIVRIFNTYGPRLDPTDGRVVSNFIVQALRGELLTVYGDGSQTRSFQYVSDLIEGMVRLMASGCSEPVNIGNSDEFTMLELAHLVREMTGTTSEITFQPLPVDDPRQRRPDISRARMELGWVPQVSLAQGLERTIAQFRYDLDIRPRQAAMGSTSEPFHGPTMTSTSMRAARSGSPVVHHTNAAERHPIHVLVTGGAGFIGSHTVKALARRGIEPVVIDNLSTGNAKAVRWGTLVRGDIGDRAVVRRALQTYPVDGVIHFAASTYVGESMEDPRKYYRNNVANMLILLEELLDAGVMKIVFSSSCATYGVTDALPIKETTEQRPVNPYGESKLAGERMLRSFGEAYGLEWVALRYFNAAGADPDGEIGEDHDPETHLIPLVIDAATGRRPAVTVFGTDYATADGTAVRDYIHVSDLADAHVCALDHLQRGGENVALNLGTGVGHSVRDIVAAVEAIGGAPVPVVEQGRRSGDPPALVADPGRAREVLGWQPSRSDLKHIVETAWAWRVGRTTARQMFAGAAADD